MSKADKHKRFRASLDLVYRIVAAVNRHYAIPRARMWSSSRSCAAVAHARMVAMFITRGATPLSFPEIGRAFRRDHSTVIHAVQSIDAAVKEDLALKLAIIEIAYLVAGGLTEPHFPPPVQEPKRLLAVVAQVPKQIPDHQPQP